MSIIIKGGNSNSTASVDAAGNLQVLTSPAAINSVAAPWTSATTDDTSQVLLSSGGYAAMVVQLNQTNITGGAGTFEGTYDGVNWIAVPPQFVLDPQTYATLSNPYSFQANTNKAYLLICGGFLQIRFRLDPAITGSGQVQIYWTLLSNSPIQSTNSTTISGSLPSGSNTIGAVTQAGSPWGINLTEVGGATFVLGSAVSADSLPVVMASDQVIPMSSAQLPGALDGSGYLKVHEQGTADVNVTNSSIAVTGTFWQATQPVSGTVTANQGGTWNVGITGTPVVTVSGSVAVTSTQLPSALDGSGNLKVAVQGTVPVSGTFWQTTQPVSSTQLPTSLDSNGNFVVSEQANQISGYAPDPAQSFIVGTEQPRIDASGQLLIRGPVMTDEGSFRTDFVGDSLFTILSGTVTFTNGSPTVTGVGTSFTTETQASYFIKKVADAETLAVTILSVDSDTQLTLSSPYQGTSTSTTAETSLFATRTGSGGGISVAASNLQIVAGVANNSVTGVLSGFSDYLPLVVEFYLSVSQAIANQNIVFGVQDHFDSTTDQQVTVQLSGTDPTVGTFVTSSSSDPSDNDTIPFVFPNNATYLTEHKYRLGISGNRTELSIDDLVVASNTLHIPGPYTNLQPVIYVENVGIPSGSTTVTCDYIYFSDVDRIQIDNQFDEPIPFSINGPSRTNNIPATVTPYRALRIAQEATQLFYDTFDTTLDTTERWNGTAGNNGFPPTTGGIDAGSVVLNPGVTVNGFSLLQSKAVFPLTLPGFLKSHWSVNLDYPTSTNCYRFWGLANTLANPTITTPLIDAIGFEIGIDGKMYAVCYAGTSGTSTTRNIIADLSAATGSGAQPVDSNAHIYFLWFSGYQAFWAIDTLENIVANMATGALGPNNDAMAMTAVSISNNTAGTLVLNGTSLGDTGRNNIAISDGKYQWRKVTVAESGVAADSTDNALVVALSPNSPLPVGTNVIGAVNINSGQSITATQGTSPWVVSGTVTTAPPSNATTNISQYGGVAVSQANPFWVEVTDGTHSMPTGDSSARSIHTTLDNSSVAVTGTVAVTQGTSPWVVSLTSTTVTNTVAENLTQVAGANLGSSAIVNYGSTPAAVAVPAVNAFVTNTVAVSGTVTANAGTGTFNTQDASVQTIGSAVSTKALMVGVKDNSGNVAFLNLDASGNLKTVTTGGSGTSSAFGATFPTNGTAIGAEYLSVPPTLTNGQMVALQTDVNGNLKVSVNSVSGTFTAAANGVTGSTVPAYADYIGFNSGGNLVGVSNSNPLPITGSITATNPSVGSNGSAFPSSSTQIGFQSGSNLVAVSSSNPLPVSNITAALVGAASPAYVGQVGGSDGTDAYPIPLSTGGKTIYNTISSPLAAAEGIYAQIFPGPPGRLLVQQPFDTLFIDPILGSSLDANLWTSFTAGSGAVTVSGALIHFSVGTTTSNGASITSVPSFTQTINPQVPVFTLTMDTTLTNGERFWGLGTIPNSWAATTPVQNGVGFEIDSSGHLWCVIYVGGVRNPASVDISSLFTSYTDGQAHNYTFVTLGNTNFFYIDSFEVPIAAIDVQSLLPSELPVHMHIINGTSTVGYSPTFNCSYVALGSSELQHVTLSDGTYDFRTITIKPASTAAAATDNALVVAVSPNNTVAVTQSTTPWVVGGVLTNNNAAPTTTNIGVLPALANTSNPSYTNGNQVLLSVDTNGNLRTIISNNPVLGAGSNIVGKVDILGNSGATLDVAQGGATAATNAVQVAGVYNSSLPTLVTGNGGAIQLDAKGQVLTDLNYIAGSAVVTAATGVQKVGIVGNGGAAFDVAIGGSQPANLIQVGGQVTSGNPAYSNTTQNALSLTTVGSVRTDITSVAGTAVTAVPSTFGSAPTGSVQGVNASLFAGTVSVPSGTFGTGPGAVTGTIPVNASLFVGTTAVVTTGTAGQIKVGISGATGVTLDAAQNAAAPANELVVGGVFNTTIPALSAGNATQFQTDSTGSQTVNTEGRKATYRCGIVGFTPIASATAPTVSVTGSGSKTVRITKIRISATASTGATVNLSLLRLSALSGGTSASQSANIAKMDTNNGSASAVISLWSAAASTATGAGIVAAERYEVVTAAVSVQPGYIEWDFGDKNGQSFVLRGTSDFAGLLFSGVGTTPVADCWIEWTEE